MNHKQIKRLVAACAFLVGFNTVTPAVAQTRDPGASNTKTFTDNFDTDHDFLSQGISDSGWDGFLGKGPRETVDRMTAAEGKRDKDGRRAVDTRP